jgi:hypothetical protein
MASTFLLLLLESLLKAGSFFQRSKLVISPTPFEGNLFLHCSATITNAMDTLLMAAVVKEDAWFAQESTITRIVIARTKNVRIVVVHIRPIGQIV